MAKTNKHEDKQAKSKTNKKRMDKRKIDKQNHKYG